MTAETKPETPVTKPIAQMTAPELKAHIDATDKAHKQKMTHLRALLRCLEAA